MAEPASIRRFKGVGEVGDLWAPHHTVWFGRRIRPDEGLEIAWDRSTTGHRPDAPAATQELPESDYAPSLVCMTPVLAELFVVVVGIC